MPLLGAGLGAGGDATTPVSRPGPFAEGCGGVTETAFAAGRFVEKKPSGS
jgi:hypothetical protein